MILHSFFSSKTRVSLLTLFMRDPDKRYYLREISKMLDESLTPIRRELLNLKKAGFLTDIRVANLIYYKVNKDFFLYGEIKSMVEKASKTALPVAK